jgi:hypothetical protein|tara:strand:+ start:230 stop:1180 length:951 start_codon:yes stop_codon:yes gene_type:complete
MSRSKKTEAQLRNKKADQFDYVGDKSVEGKLQEIEFMPSSLETIDRAFYRFVDEDVNLFATTSEGFKKVPVLWVTAERSYQIKAWENKELRDTEQTLRFPLATVHRASVTKDPTRKGTVYANLYAVPGARGGVITTARTINQKKTAEFQNAFAARSYGPDKNVAGKMKNSNKRNMSVQRVVYETISMPIPTWVVVKYEVHLRSEYQQQMNELIRPFITIPGNSRMPKRIQEDGHYYEVFIDGGFSNGSNAANLGMEHRNYENTINIEVLGYLMGEGENQQQPVIVKRENAVEFKLSREKVIFGDIPNNLKDGFYRD